MIIIDEQKLRSLGNGKIAPQGSVNNQALAARLASYKRQVAGNYRSVSPAEIATAIPHGQHFVSEKIDGETWYLYINEGEAYLLSPTGRAITGVPATDEATKLFSGWSGLLAGELYAVNGSGRSRVYDLHAALGGGASAETDRLRFAAFDILQDGDEDAQHLSFSERVDRLRQLLPGGEYIHAVYFREAPDASLIVDMYEKVVARGAEGIVVRGDNGKSYKIKPEITIDAAVVGFSCGVEGSVNELLLALRKPDGDFQLIGRVYNGFSAHDRRDLHQRLTPLIHDSSYRKVSSNGALYRWVRSELVVEVKCNDLIAANSKDEPVRRMRLKYDNAEGWKPRGPAPSISMINCVFRRIRDDKESNIHDVRFSQVADIAHVESEPTVNELPVSVILRREVYVKKSKAGISVRKLLVWRTSKKDADGSYPAFVAFFTDYSPGRKEPLRTDLRVASTGERISRFADYWRAANVKRGWEAVSSELCAASKKKIMVSDEQPCATRSSSSPPLNVPGSPPKVNNAPPTANGSLTIAFARSSSAGFPMARKRLDALAKSGSLDITLDDKGREAWFELTLNENLIENARRIANLINMVRTWKATEITKNGDPFGRHELDNYLARLERVRRCWSSQKETGSESCRSSCKLGCLSLHIVPTCDSLYYTADRSPAWYGVGGFDGKVVAIDKVALLRQEAGGRNAEVCLCPFYDHAIIEKLIADLPDTLSTESPGFSLIYQNEDGAPAWVWPEKADLPIGFTRNPNQSWRNGIHVKIDSEAINSKEEKEDRPRREIPDTRFSDICGQDEAVEAVRDMVTLPLLHADLFLAIGAKPPVGGIILAGPPGTGKTLLARAVAGECNAHIEIVSGPELLSMWVGETEKGLRKIFERAREREPSIILFDEIDSIAPIRSANNSVRNSIVAQLLTLMDGFEDRGRVFTLATTNRPDDVDPALRRPGRFDQVVWMGAPNEHGRAAIFKGHTFGLKLEAGLDREILATDLASITDGLTGADIAHVCSLAAVHSVKAAVNNGGKKGYMAIRTEHFEAAIRSLVSAERTSHQSQQRTPPEKAVLKRGSG